MSNVSVALATLRNFNDSATYKGIITTTRLSAKLEKLTLDEIESKMVIGARWSRKRERRDDISQTLGRFGDTIAGYCAQEKGNGVHCKLLGANELLRLHSKPLLWYNFRKF
jgi:hypothetical protein